tara:strand:+ start:1152 stop:1577 length:426 start_codon:yes stop_codon:yes gene_type:complete
MHLIPKHPLARLDSLFDDTFPAFKLLPESDFNNSKLAVDIKEKGDCYIIKADFPGINKDDIQISIEDNILTIEAEYEESKEAKEDGKYLRQERRYGKYSRSFNLGKNVDEAQIKAEFDKGVLSLKVPKGDVAPATRTIPIK